MAEYIVNFRKIERFVDRVVMTPIYTKHMSDKETELLKRNLIKVGYKYIGRSKDMYDNYYTTYEQQKKFYDKNNAYESLGALFFEWLTSGYMTAKQMQDVYREGTKECKEYIFEDLFHLVGHKTFYQFVRIFNFDKK